MSEYIKKEDLFNKTIKRNSIWNKITNAEGKGLEEIVNDLPTYSIPDSAENKGEWIPVKWIPNGRCGYPKPEEEYKHFLTIDNKGEITIQEFLLSLDEEPQPYFTGMRNIVAWQPLPEPYEGGDV